MSSPPPPPPIADAPEPASVIPTHLPFKTRIKISVVQIAHLQREDGSWELDDVLAFNLGLGPEVFQDLVVRLQEEQGGKALSEKDKRVIATSLVLDVVNYEMGKQTKAKKQIRDVEGEPTQVTVEDLVKNNPSLGVKVGWDKVALKFATQNRLPPKWMLPVGEIFKSIKSRDVVKKKTCPDCHTEFWAQRARCPRCTEKSAPPLLSHSPATTLNGYVFSGAAGPRPLSKRIDWEKLVGVRRVPGGLGAISGVFFVEFSDGVVVLKFGGLNCASEYYCSLLFAELPMKSTEMQILSQDEFNEFKAKLEDVPFSPDEARQTLHVGKVLPVMMMEFVPGEVLMGLSHPEYLDSPEVNFEIGRILAIDLLTNNYDRLPLIWNNEGNSGNIIFSQKDQLEVYGIDQCVTGINNDKGTESYIEQVVAELEAAKAGRLTEGFSQIKETIFNDTGHTLSDAACFQIQKGLIQGAKDILESITPRLLKELKEETEELFTEKGYTEVQTDMIDLGFMERVLTAFASVLKG